ncbi:uncharacterized protein METZ01_LOCUS91018, partial [marine metagenome]
MKRIFGIGLGIVYLVIAFGAYAQANAGWADGHADL